MSTLNYLTETENRMMFDFVYEGISLKEIANKYGVPEKKLQEIQKSPVWQLEEKKLWNEIIAQLIYRRDSKAVVH